MALLVRRIAPNFVLSPRQLAPKLYNIISQPQQHPYFSRLFASPSSATMTSRPAPLVLPAKGAHTATLIFAHGLGDQATGWAEAVAYWRSRGHLDHVKVVLPNAPRIPITCVSLLS